MVRPPAHHHADRATGSPPTIAGRDADETANVALCEKLKRFALKFPDYDPDGGVELYLDSVTAVLTNPPRGRICRWATIGLFSFAHRATRSNLEPSRWPAADEAKVQIFESNVSKLLRL